MVACRRRQVGPSIKRAILPERRPSHVRFTVVAFPPFHPRYRPLVKILLVEDEPTLRTSLAEHLRADGYLCEEAADYAQAHERIKLYYYDCVVVDLTLPGGNGLDLVRTLKADGSTAGVLIVSARGALPDKVLGLELGADDYLTKPFHLAELSARVHALLRRRQFQGAAGAALPRAKCAARPGPGARGHRAGGPHPQRV